VSEAVVPESTSYWWPLQSIDTVKYSRDMARHQLTDEDFKSIIDNQTVNIARTGVTHIAIATPYDPEFVPFLRLWVSNARKHKLKVWFRGNFAGWEGWFGYPKIDRAKHLELLSQFILDNGDIFEDGDIFSPCTECENGGPGDPRQTKDIAGHRQFLIDEYKVARESFRKVGKNVESNYFSMNADVARIIMDKTTTRSLGGLVVIDHYVPTSEKLETDIRQIAKESGGKVVLGEFGAPIPNIHGKMTEEEQSAWIDEALLKISQIPELVGVNYWTSVGGSTEIWDENGKPSKSADILKKFYFPKLFKGRVVDELGTPIKDAKLTLGGRSALTNSKGEFSFAYLQNNEKVIFTSQNYYPKEIQLVENIQRQDVVLITRNGSFFFKLRKFLKYFLSTY
jgi:hypothetical protein